MSDIVAIYARISQEKGEIDVSIPQQIEQGIAFAKSKGMSFEIYQDEGFSGTLEATQRPAMYQLLQDIVKKDSKIKILWGREHFRLYRGNTPKYQIQLTCKKNNVDIYYADKKYEATDIMEKAMDGFLGVMGEFYVDLTKQNINQAISKNFREGKAHGLAPYGYKTGEGKQLEIDIKQAKWVKKMFDWHIKGLGLTAITKKLTELEVPTQFDLNTKHVRFSKQWDRTTIYGILKNKLYHGIRTHNKWEKVQHPEKPNKLKRVLVSSKEISVPHLAIVDEHTYNQSLLAFEKLKSYTGKKTKHKYLLIDLLECGQCGGRYLGRADNRNHDVYKCNNKRKWSAKIKTKEQTCNNRDIRKPVIEKFVWEFISDGSILLKYLLAKSSNDNENQNKELEAELLVLEKAKERLKTEWNTARISHRKGLYTDEELEADKKQIEREKIEYDVKIKNLKAQVSTAKNEKDLKKEILKDFHKRTGHVYNDSLPKLEKFLKQQESLKKVLDDNYSFNNRQEFLKKYINKILIDYTEGIFKITFKFKSPLSQIIVYMDRNFYNAISVTSSTIHMYDLNHPKVHNRNMNLDKLFKTIELLDKNINEKIILFSEPGLQFWLREGERNQKKNKF